MKELGRHANRDAQQDRLYAQQQRRDVQFDAQLTVVSWSKVTAGTQFASTAMMLASTTTMLR